MHFRKPPARYPGEASPARAPGPKISLTHLTVHWRFLQHGGWLEMLANRNRGARSQNKRTMRLRRKGEALNTIQTCASSPFPAAPSLAAGVAETCLHKDLSFVFQTANMLTYRWKLVSILLAICILLYFTSDASLTHGWQAPFSNEPQLPPDEVDTSPTVTTSLGSSPPSPTARPLDSDGGRFDWSKLPMRWQVSSLTPLPTGKPQSIPKIQYTFAPETSKERGSRLTKLDLIKGNFTHAWQGYKKHAWLRDEVMPLSGNSLDPFGGWAATLVDSLGKCTHYLPSPQVYLHLSLQIRFG